MVPKLKDTVSKGVHMYKKYFPILLVMSVACGKASNHFPDLPLVNSKSKALNHSISSSHNPFVLTAPVLVKANIKNSQSKLLEVMLNNNNLDDLKDNYRNYVNRLFADHQWGEFQKLSLSIPLFQITDDNFYNLKSQIESVVDLRTSLVNDSLIIKTSELKKYTGFQISLYDPSRKLMEDLTTITEKNAKEGVVEITNLNRIIKNRNANPLFVLRSITPSPAVIIFDGINTIIDDSAGPNIEAQLKKIDPNSTFNNNRIELFLNLNSSEELGSWEYFSDNGKHFVSFQMKKFRSEDEKSIKEFNISYQGESSSIDLKNVFEIDLFEELTVSLSNFSYSKFDVKTQENSNGSSYTRHRRIEYVPSAFDIAEFSKQGFYLNLKEFSSKSTEQSIVYKYSDGVRTSEVEKVILKIKIHKEQYSKSSINLLIAPNTFYTIYEQQKWVGYWENAGEILSFANHVSFQMSIEQN